MNRFTYTAEDGKAISVVEWADIPYVKGIVQISHGMAEHILRYEPLAEYLNSLGYLVFGDDHRCFGYTDPDTLGYSEGNTWESTLSDLAGLTDLYRKNYPSVPIVLLGHSYGSFLTQAYIERYGDKLAGAVLCGSCMMKNANVPLGYAVACIGNAFKGGRAKAELIKKLTFDAYDKKFTEGDFINSIREESELYNADPLCGSVCSYNFYKNFFKGLMGIYQKSALACVPKYLPLLLIAGEDDPVGEMGAGMEKLYQMYLDLGIRDVTLRLFPGNRHELLRDTAKNEAVELIVRHLEACCES